MFQGQQIMLSLSYFRNMNTERRDLSPSSNSDRGRRGRRWGEREEGEGTRERKVRGWGREEVRGNKKKGGRMGWERGWGEGEEGEGAWERGGEGKQEERRKEGRRLKGLPTNQLTTRPTNRPTYQPTDRRAKGSKGSYTSNNVLYQSSPLTSSCKQL